MFYPTNTDGTYVDDKGKFWPLSPSLVTQLRNNGQVADFPAASGGGGTRDFEATGVPTTNPGVAPVRGQLQGLPIQFGGAGGAPMQPTAPSEAPAMTAVPQKPAVNPSYSPLKGLPQQYGGAPAQQQQARNLQRVLPSQRGQQQGAPEQQRYFQKTAPTKAEWVDTARQTSGISQEQQDDARKRVLELRDAQVDAAKEQVMAQGTLAQAQRFRAERDIAENSEKIRQKQQEQDTSNLYIQSQQQKVADRLKAAREKQVDPTRQFKSAQGGIAGVLAVLGSALGQYSSGINGGPNNALQLFNNMIEREVNEQLRLINEEKDGAMMAKSELDDFQFRSDEEAKAYIRAIEMEKKAADLRMIAADEAMVATHPMAKQLLADIDQRTNDSLMQVNQAINRTAGERFQPARSGGVVDITGKVLAQQERESSARANIAKNERAIASGGGDPKEAVKIAGEVRGYSPNAKKLNDQYAAYERFKGNVQMAEDLITNGSMLDDSRYESLVNDMMFDLAEAKGTTIRSDTDVKQFGDMLGGTSRAKVRPENQKKILRDALRRAGSSVYNAYRQEGIPTDGIEPDEMLRSE